MANVHVRSARVCTPVNLPKCGVKMTTGIPEQAPARFQKTRCRQGEGSRSLSQILKLVLDKGIKPGIADDMLSFIHGCDGMSISNQFLCTCEGILNTLRIGNETSMATMHVHELQVPQDVRATAGGAPDCLQFVWRGASQHSCSVLPPPT